MQSNADNSSEESRSDWESAGFHEALRALDAAFHILKNIGPSMMPILKATKEGRKRPKIRRFALVGLHGKALYGDSIRSDSQRLRFEGFKTGHLKISTPAELKKTFAARFADARCDVSDRTDRFILNRITTQQIASNEGLLRELFEDSIRGASHLHART